MDKMEELIAELEKAEGGSRKLDKALLDFIDPEGVSDRHWALDYPKYTTDLNAALALVGEKAEEAFGEHVLIGVHRGRHKIPFAPYNGRYEWFGWLRLHAQDAVEAKSFAGPAVALLLALLNSLKEGSNNG